MSAVEQKKFDLVVYGASSFVGRILCRYLCEHSDESFRWAIAGRSQFKLETFKVEMGAAAEEVSVIQADAHDEAALIRMCDQTQVVISTVGPYALYGETLIRVCTVRGTDYCDLTGEPQWIAKMLSLYESQAKKSGARIVHSCGFDSIPSDLGVYYLQQLSARKFGIYCDKVKLAVKTMKGAASGGTIASAVNMIKEAAANPEIKRQLADPYSLCPPDHGFRHPQQETGVKFDQDFKTWSAPFMMAVINIRIVHRSNCLFEEGYHPQFDYQEMMLTSGGAEGKKAARRIARNIRLGTMVMSVPPVRAFLTRFILPRPGQGPTEDQQRYGSFDIRLHGVTKTGDTVQVKVTGDRDPGYGSTAKMLGQTGLCLALDCPESERVGGFWTTATLMGDALIERLTNYAGMDFGELRE